MSRSACATNPWLALLTSALAFGWVPACWANVVSFQFKGPAIFAAFPDPAEHTFRHWQRHL